MKINAIKQRVGELEKELNFTMTSFSKEWASLIKNSKNKNIDLLSLKTRQTALPGKVFQKIVIISKELEIYKRKLQNK